jgi:hypothetical protein
MTIEAQKLNTLPAKEFVLKRITQPNPIQETAGVLMEFGQFPFAVTLERPWINNEPNISCIPVGIYKCRPVFWKKHGFWTWQVMEVKGRTDIYVHGGSTKEHTLGCILVAESFIQLNNKPAIQDVHGFKEFLHLADPQKEDGIQLIIQWV